MKKSFVFLTVLALIVTLGITCAAAPTAPEGITTAALFDFSALENGTKKAGDFGFWAPDASSNCDVTVKDGVVTFSENVWGAFPTMSADQQAILKDKSGVGFYFKAGAEGAEIALGFNANDTAGTNHVLADGKTVILANVNGKVKKVTTGHNSGFNQGTIAVPANFEGYIYIPFSAYVKNGTSTAFDLAASQPATFIYVIGAGAPLSYGEFVAYTGTYEGASDTADVSVIAYAFAALTGLGSLAFLRKKK